MPRVIAVSLAALMATAALPAAAANSPKDTKPEPKPTASAPSAKEKAAADAAAQRKAQEIAERAAEQEAAEERARQIATATTQLQTQLAQVQKERADAQKRFDRAQRLASDARAKVVAQEGAVATARDLVGAYARAAYQSGPTELTYIASVLDADSPQDAMRRADTVERVGQHKDAKYDDAQVILQQAQTAAEAAEAAAEAARRGLDDITAKESSIRAQIANVAVQWANVLADSGQDDAAKQQQANSDAAQTWATWLTRPAAKGAPSVTVTQVETGERLPDGVTVKADQPGVAWWRKTPKTKPVLLLPDRTTAAVTHAVSLLGAGYKWRSNTGTFMDCSSLIDRAWNVPQAGKDAAKEDRDLVTGGVTGLARGMRLLPIQKLTPGDVVYYRDGKHGVNHAGIAVTPRVMIAADAATGAVNAITIDRDRAWKVGRQSAAFTGSNKVAAVTGKTAWQCGANPNEAVSLPSGGLVNMPAACPAKPEVFGEANMQPAAILVGRCAAAAWPQLTTIGGWRPSDPYPDHPSGQALDIMMPAGCSTDPANLATGNAIAEYFMKNHEKFGVVYMIWQQRLWNATYEDPKPLDQWRGMSNRGSCTANHQDHVHVSTIGAVTLG